MLTDLEGVVIDTNVLVHACNNGIGYYDSSTQVLDHILVSELQMYVDDVFDADESRNTSRINHEYITHVRSGTLAYAFLISMAMTGRISQVEERVYNKKKKLFNQMVRNRDDIIFLSVTMCTPDKFLISNDFEDYSYEKRRLWRKKHDLNILDSSEVAVAIASTIG